MREVPAAALVFLSFISFAWGGPAGLLNEPEDRYRFDRVRMVSEQVVSRGIKDKKLIQAMLDVPRHEFIPAQYIGSSFSGNPYGDYPVSIGEGQTISQPYIVAFMTEALGLKGGERVLEIGSGSGYQAAILSKLAKEVYTVEIIQKLADWSAYTLENYGNVKSKQGDGYLGWPEYAPFDRIIVTCAPDHIPQPLIDQLSNGGKMVIPVGDYPKQSLVLMEKKKNGRIYQRNILQVLFVPMTGAETEKRKKKEK